jgi:UDP-N-acetylglucosamine--N-acetylmuramyl-(pentapeptide) pyrophosphoryl-undecaprenol N-acetylglucosamine transferase
LTTSPTIIFAGGGSGGHISPGLAIAERVREIAPDAKCIFVCSQRGIDATMLSDANVRFVAVPATPPAAKPAAVLRFLMNFNASKTRVSKLIRAEKVDHVVALGGFVAAPAVAAAKSCKTHVLLVNLDAPPGKANQWMARRCDDVISAIDIPTMPDFARQVVGMPIRRRALATGTPAECRSRLKLDPRRKTLLVTGASQGATSINAFTLEFVRAHFDLFRGGSDSWQLLHLTGSSADEPARAAYGKLSVNATVHAFLNDIGLAWGAADLAISRAGASSVAEAAHNAVPTLFLPYPHHKDMHQKHNAQPLVDMDGAVMEIDRIDAAKNLEHVGPVLKDLMENAERRAALRANLRSHPHPDAAMTIARMLVHASVTH